ncbi:putative DNA helicase [methanotrophic endosymbiont of Bathymodiolus azoricus (Menez Gwen)]|nr:putative DNA helicase [methanotrophic endosymbiont of Bathymodiolus azoricus (Menez Gwen)]
MSAVLRQFEFMAKLASSSVLLIHHEGKGSLNDSDAGTAASRGASAITDNARWHMRLQRMTRSDAENRGVLEDDERRRWIRVTNEKANYGEEMSEAWLLRGEAGVLSSSVPLIKTKNANGGRRNG